MLYGDMNPTQQAAADADFKSYQDSIAGKSTPTGSKRWASHVASQRRGIPIVSTMGQMGKDLGRFLMYPGEAVNRGLSKGTMGVVGATGRSWDKKGIGTTLGSYAKMGMLYGGLSATVNYSMNRYISDEAMAQSQQGGTFEGNDQFGNRRSSSVRSMGESAMGLVQGMQNRRHG